MEGKFKSTTNNDDNLSTKLRFSSRVDRSRNVEWKSDLYHL